MIHAVEECISWVQLDDNPVRYILAGPNQSGDPSEIVIVAIEGAELVIHATALRRRTAEELYGGGD